MRELSQAAGLQQSGHAPRSTIRCDQRGPRGIPSVVTVDQPARYDACVSVENVGTVAKKYPYWSVVDINAA